MKSYLRNHRTDHENIDKQGILLNIACDVASGLQAMHQSNFVHRFATIVFTDIVDLYQRCVDCGFLCKWSGVCTNFDSSHMVVWSCLTAYAMHTHMRCWLGDVYFKYQMYAAFENWIKQEVTVNTLTLTILVYTNDKDVGLYSHSPRLKCLMPHT